MDFIKRNEENIGSYNKETRPHTIWEEWSADIQERTFYKFRSNIITNNYSDHINKHVSNIRNPNESENFRSRNTL